MNKLLHTLILLSATLSCQPGGAAEPVLPAAHSLVPAAATSEALLPAPTQQLRLAAIGDGLGLSGNAHAAGRPAPNTTNAAKPTASAVPVEALPSTPIALACLGLIICILVSRRNADELID